MIPSLDLRLKRVLGQPSRRCSALCRHVLVEIAEILWMLGQPYERIDTCVPGFLMDCMFVVCDVLVSSIYQKAWQRLKHRANSVKTEAFGKQRMIAVC